MKFGKKMAWILAAGALLAAAVPFTSMAASRKKISSVTIDVEANIQPHTKYGDEEIEVTTRGGKYSFDYYEIDHMGFEWETEDVPRIVIYLQAEDGYYFSLSKASAVKLTGATYVSATKQNSSETLRLVVKLRPLAESVADMSEVTLTDNGYAIWDAVEGAGSYELRIYRNGEGVGLVMLTTTDTWYDFNKQMSKPGSYYVKVRPVNGVNTENKGEWAESAGVSISSEQAAAIRSGTAGPMPMRGAWKEDGNGRWYEYSDGSYPKNQWLDLDGKTYFFDESGYVKTGWVDWNGKRYYCDSSGAMLKNTITPDGYILDYDGTIKTD
ncbi:MAG: hypothetical protein Q4C73_03920 [Eubacteriales bacterium]|nr:hypothetical protein [Eubacteriales bacterium]